MPSNTDIEMWILCSKLHKIYNPNYQINNGMKYLLVKWKCSYTYIDFELQLINPMQTQSNPSYLGWVGLGNMDLGMGNVEPYSGLDMNWCSSHLSDFHYAKCDELQKPNNRNLRVVQ